MTVKIGQLGWCGAAVVAAMLFASTQVAAAVVVGVNIAKSNAGDVDDTAGGGIFWNTMGMDSGGGTDYSLQSLQDGAGNASDFTAQILNLGDNNPFEWNESVNALLTAEGYRWPEAVNEPGLAENFGFGSRDGKIVIRFTVPTSSGLTDWSISVMGGGFNTFHINVGGTWGGSGDPTFTGGVTATETGSGIRTATITGITPTIDGSNYMVDFQFGADAGQSGVASLQGIIINANVPEPGSLALMGLGGLAMLGRRRSA